MTNYLPIPLRNSLWRRGCGLLVTLAMLGTSLRSAAAEGQAPQGEPSFLILGVTNEGKLDPELRAYITQRIGSENGIARAPELRATESELMCREEACLRALAAQISWPNYIIGGAILPQPGAANSDGRLQISLAIYDVVKRSVLEARGVIPGRCQGDQAPGRSACLAEIDNVLEKLFSAKSIGIRDGKPVGGPAYFTFGRGLAQGISGGLALGGLVAGAAVSYADRQTYEVHEIDGSTTQITPQLGRYSTAGFAVMGAGLLGSIGSGVWGLWNMRGTGRTASREERLSYLKGLLIGSTSSLLLTSLIAASAMQANEGSQCIGNRPDLTCTFYPSPAGLGWGMMAVWTAGLTASIGFSIAYK